jgi:SAM-dependent methyltransferase
VPVIEDIVARRVPVIMDVGCAEGYYAVGLARRMPQTVVHARDINPKALALVTDLAQANGVADRVLVGEGVTHVDFDLCLAQDTVVICDIEGAEDALLDPVAAPGLHQADILVEVHDCFAPGLSDRLADRFAATHDVTRIGRRLDDTALPDWAETLGDLDRLLFLWEWRSGPTPWLWLQSKARQAKAAHGKGRP